MSEWKEYRLSDIAEIHDSKRIPLNSRDRSSMKGNSPYYGASGIVDYINDYIFYGEYVLISEDGENLRSRQTPIAFKVNGKFWVNNHAHILKGRDELINDFIVYYFRNLNISPYITGAVQPKLNMYNLLSIPIFMPENRAERVSITRTLLSLDNKIHLLRRQNETLEAIAQTLFKRWFVEFEFPDENGRPYKSSGGKMVSSELGEIPDGWRVGILGDEFDILMGQSPPGKSYNEIGEGLIFFQGRTDFGFRFPTIRLYTTNPKRIADKYDALVSVRAPVGDINIAFDKCCIGRGLSAIKSKYKSYCLYKIQSYKKIFDVFENEGTVFGALNKENFNNLENVIPLQSRIEMFDNIIQPLDKKIFNNENEIRNLNKIRDILLPKLMSGQILVKEN